MAFKLAIGTFLTAINKRHCFEKRINSTVLLEQCESVSFSWRNQTKKEQCEWTAFHQQKQIETQTEQYERSLSVFQRFK